MIRKHITKGLAVLSILLAVQSCYKDKGNYDYHAIGDVEISGINDSEVGYNAIALEETLKIPVTIKTSTAEDKLSYFWTINKQYTSGGVNESKVVVDTISRQKDLEYFVNVSSGNYDLTFTVDNNETGVRYYHKTKLTTSTRFTHAFYVLKDFDNACDLDLFRRNGDQIVSDINMAMFDEHIPGAPVSLSMVPGYWYMNDNAEYEMTNIVNVVTAEDARIYDTKTMDVLYNFETMFYGPVSPQKPLLIRRQPWAVLYFSSIGVNSSYQQGFIQSAGKFGDPPYISGGYNPFLNIFVCTDNMGTVHYDKLNGKFMLTNYNGDTSHFAETGIYPNKIDHEILYMGGNYVSGDKVYAMFQDKDNAATRHMYTLVPGFSSGTNPITAVTTFGAETAFSKATMYACKERLANVIYYVTDNKFYVYDVALATEKQVALSGIGAGEEITYIANRFWLGGKEDQQFDYVTVGTYKDGKYKLYFYETRAGEPDGAPKLTLSGDGKVIGVQYVNEIMTDSHTNDLPGAN